MEVMKLYVHLVVHLVGAARKSHVRAEKLSTGLYRSRRELGKPRQNFGRLEGWWALFPRPPPPPPRSDPATFGGFTVCFYTDAGSVSSRVRVRQSLDSPDAPM